jgi:molybdate transport system ATP-binding protein
MIYIDIKKRLHGVVGEMELECQLNIKKGDFIAVSGPSGSGKTTFLRILAGLEKARGKIEVENEIWLDGKKCLPPQKREIGFVFQDFALFPNMTVLENLLYVKKDRNFALELLKTSGIEELKDRYPSMLSGGQKQRVALCRALMRKPKLLLLDEPFSALDPRMREKLQNEIALFHKKYDLTTVMVSHSPSEIYRLADKMVELVNGKITKIDSPSRILLKTSGTQKFSLEGKIIDIIKIDKIYIAVVSVGNQISEVVISQNEAEKFKVSQRVIISTKAFHPNIKPIKEENENSFS